MPRLRLKPKTPQTGHVDGAWWPHSDNLTKELPDLIAGLSVQLGDIERVRYHRGEWANAPVEHTADGHPVRLDGYRRQPINTIEVLGLNHDKVRLLVIRPYTDPDYAHTAMMAAAGPDNASTVDGLLVTSTRDKTARIHKDATEQRWMDGSEKAKPAESLPTLSAL